MRFLRRHGCTPLLIASLGLGCSIQEGEEGKRPSADEAPGPRTASPGASRPGPEDLTGGEPTAPGGGEPTAPGGGETPVAPACVVTDPGTVVLRRLNRTEYNNTLRDLTGLDGDFTADLPADDLGYGFDNIADVLTTSSLLVEKMEVVVEQVVEQMLAAGPSGSEPPAPRTAVLVCAPTEELSEQACAREIFARFGKRAFRRPLSDGELARLTGLLTIAEEEGQGFEAGIRLGLEALLLSPHFLYRVELDPDPNAAESRTLTGYELATRLSYFLWSTMPDEELFERADDDSLVQSAVLEQQVRRMLADEKSAALVDNFGAQWLHLRDLETAAPEATVFPAFDAPLRAAMAEEASLFLHELVREDKDLRELLTGEFTYLNERLAQHYGIDGITGEQMQRVDLTGHPERGGILTQGAFLTLTAYPTRTSPVKRGKLVLDQLLCLPPAPPPPEVEGIIEELAPSGTLREIMELHRAHPDCASCHTLMDPIGFGLENFDGVGAWRTEDHGFPIDPADSYLGLTDFSGPKELSALIAGDEQFASCAIRKAYTYALGRGLDFIDACSIAHIEHRFVQGGYPLSELFLAIAESDSFRTRRSEGGTP
jgi:hypothetical protein